MRKLAGSLVALVVLFVLFQAVASPDPRDLAGIMVQPNQKQEATFPYTVYHWGTSWCVPDEFVNWELTDEPRYHGLNQATITLHPELKDGSFYVRELVGLCSTGTFAHMNFRPSVNRGFVLGPTGTVLVYELGGPAQELAEKMIRARMFGRSVDTMPDGISEDDLHLVMIANHEGGTFLYKRRLMGELATAALVESFDQANTFFRRISYPAVEDDIFASVSSEGAMTQK